MSTFSIPGLGPTSVPSITWSSAGAVAPTESDILAGVQIDIDYAFGGGTNPALETPQGQIATSSAAIISDKNSQILYLINQIDPRYSSGRFQDAIGRIYFLTRKGATSTVVICILGGLANTVVPAGTLAQDTSGNTYTLNGTVTIPASGSVSSTWANNTTGPLPCPAGTLSKVYQAIPGWDTITNPSDGALGSDVETSAEFEIRRSNSVASNSRGTTASIYASVFAVDDVLDCYVLDNPSGSIVLSGATGYPLQPHSIYVAVLGGLDADVAQAIWEKKDAGCSYNGNTTIVVTDPSGYSYPQPQYNVTFERPADLPIFFAVQITGTGTLPSNIVSLITAAIVARFNGADGTTRERIGSTVLASRYYSAINGLSDSIVILGIQVGTSANPVGTAIQVGIDQTPSISLANITVTQS